MCCYVNPKNDSFSPADRFPITADENGKAYVVKVERELRLPETPLSVSLDFVGPEYPTLCCPLCGFEYTHQENVKEAVEAMLLESELHIR